MGYCQVSDVKVVLQVSSETETYDQEILDCISSADALIDNLLKQRDLCVSSPVSQVVVDASAHFAAWLFRRRRDPVGAEAFWVEANRFLEIYCEAEGELAFKVCQA